MVARHYITVALFLSPLLLFPSAISWTKLPENGRGVNVTCIQEKCLEEYTSCAKTKLCEDAFQCFCNKSVTQCMYDALWDLRCFQYYNDDVLYRLAACAVTREGCITPNPPMPEYKCKKPTNLYPKFDIRTLADTWFVYRGYPAGYHIPVPPVDCYDCQSYTFSYDLYNTTACQGKKQYSVNIRADLQRNFTYKSLFVVKSPTGNIIQSTGTEFGLFRSDEFRILDYYYWGSATGYVLAYYCGTFGFWPTEGVIMLIRPWLFHLPPDVIKRAEQAAASNGYDLSKFCTPNNKPYATCYRT
ncbi:violaxanthin de-epoxidase, chloroplastic-like [Lingula anatina]|uniref:Violaxanthin de-epoxidase, chloroplastic-like n=1 Tax=Lingula anatina TaxID=7574 RepID=A0A1S3HDJ3_LINAN|nr:violaxanthin de-epoxidase, chloroplastic-like [Lingula anatina]|eukprot:XP_013384103.1 violaxanthin de-epoxidase, chloroplastic-like [Lingula anatina]